MDSELVDSVRSLQSEISSEPDDGRVPLATVELNAARTLAGFAYIDAVEGKDALARSAMSDARTSLNKFRSLRLQAKSGASSQSQSDASSSQSQSYSPSYSSDYNTSQGIGIALGVVLSVAMIFGMYYLISH